MPEPEPPPRTTPVTIDIDAVTQPLHPPAEVRPEPVPALPPQKPWGTPPPPVEEPRPKSAWEASLPTIDVKPELPKRSRPAKPPKAPKTPKAPKPPKAPRAALPVDLQRELPRIGGWTVALVVIWGAAWVIMGQSWEGFQLERKHAKQLHAATKSGDEGKDFPWQRQAVRTAKAATLQDWLKIVGQLDAENAALERLAVTSDPGPANGVAAPLEPAWDALSPGKMEFQGQLVNSALSEAQLRDHFTKVSQALTELERLTAEAGTAAGPPSEATLRAFYDRFLNEMTVPETFLVRHIFLAAHAGTPSEKIEAQRVAAEGIAQRLLAGEGTLETLAEKYSEDEATKRVGGLLPRFSADRMPADFLEAINAAVPGELHGPVKTSLGYHLFTVEARLPARRLPFEEARPHLLRAFTQAQLAIERRRQLE